MPQPKGHKSILLQTRLLFTLILANFLAQVVYFFHLYYNPGRLSLYLRPSLLMGAVFLLFMTGSILFFYKNKTGYWLLTVFLAAEFLFYLWNAIGSVVHGLGLFFQIYNPDPILKIVFIIGYVNFFAAGYFLFLLISKRNYFLHA
jgi:hypothetical protein